jgi:hypothetical protein
MYILGFNLLRVERDHSLYMKWILIRKRGFMTGESCKGLFICLFVSPRACDVGIYAIRDS